MSEFQQAGIQARNANKAKMAGIEKVSEYMKQGKFYVVKDGVDQFLDEIYQYVWDDKTGEPVKENDHVMDSLRYAVFNQHRDNQARTIRSRYFWFYAYRTRLIATKKRWENGNSAND